MTRTTSEKVFEALAKEERRELLVMLLENEEVVIPEEVSTIPENKMIQYYHSHLPKLDEFGLIEWSNDEADVIRRGPVFDEAEPLLEVVEEQYV